jgi:hypothetical protein
LAAQLDATGISVEPRNKRGKTAKKVKDVKKIAISFTIVKNITAKTGERTLYIRIAKPDNDILTKNASNTFPYENRNLVYSIKKYIEYTGEEQNVTVYWDVEEYLPALTPISSSRVIPGLRGIPEVITTTSELAVFS